MKKKKIIIAFGGPNNEHNISIKTAKNIIKHIKNPICLYWKKNNNIIIIKKKKFLNNIKLTKNKKIMNWKNINNLIKNKDIKNYIFLNLMHGKHVEDGEIQKKLEKKKISYNCSNKDSCRNTFNKLNTKQQIKNKKIKFINSICISKKKINKSIIKIINFINNKKKIIIKPIDSGSSMGIIIYRKKKPINKIILYSSLINKIIKKKHKFYTIEKFINNKEFSTGIIELNYNKIMFTKILKKKKQFFNYKNKYINKKNIEILEKKKIIYKELNKKINNLYYNINNKNYSRFDFLYKKEKMLLIEINSLPGLTDKSIIVKQLKENKIRIKYFLTKQIKLII